MTKKHALRFVNYNPKTGEFKYIHTGKPANKVSANGYIRVSIEGKRYQAHRLAWIIVNGSIPEDMQIDHINHDRTDNRISNLRIATALENRRNRELQANNSTGVNGVSVDARTGRYEVHVKVKGKKIWLGTYNTMPEAKAARYAANKVIGFHKNHGVKM